MPDLNQKIIEKLRGWSQYVILTGEFARCYLFGSLVNLEGRNYKPGSSDVDMVLLFGDQAEEPSDKLIALRRIREQKPQIEAELLSLLTWDDASAPAMSIVAVTQLEVERDIHKDRNPSFFSGNRFLDLLSGEVAESLATPKKLKGADKLQHKCYPRCSEV